MNTRKTFRTCVVCLLAALAAGLGIYIQGSHSANAANQERREMRNREMQEKEEAARERRAFEFHVGEFGFGEEAVKGAPFSADLIIEETQTLANGLHISNKATGKLYRDSEGRTRREQPRDGETEIVFINDPVARVFSRLHMFEHSALKVTYSPEVAAREKSHSEREAKERQLAEDRELGRERKVEALGSQTIEGVQAEGKRITFTIAAGRENNDQPFTIVSETWYSPALHAVVLSKHSDPRKGDSIYRLANVNPGEPAHSLFEVPADFTIKMEKVEGRRM